MSRRHKAVTLAVDFQAIPIAEALDLDPADLARNSLPSVLARLRTAAGSAPLKITAEGGGIINGPLGLENPDVVLIDRHDLNQIIRRLTDTTQ
jgi:hypothetical protein